MFKDYLKKVLDGEILSEEESYHAAEYLLHDDIEEAKVAAFLAIIRSRKEDKQEIMGFIKALQEKAVKMECDHEVLDTCGTGGDGLATFNISTATAIIVASCGAHVAKHGNRAVSSKSGSADVLEALGCRVDLSPEESLAMLDKVGITFLFAPYYHPVMKKVATIRKNLGIPTIFNFLGPLLNPFSLSYQVMGVSDPVQQEVLAQSVALLGRKRALVIHAENGMDEISPIGRTKVYDIKGDKSNSYYIEAEDYGIKDCKIADISGKDAIANARLIYKLFEGKKGAARDTVLINAGAALFTAGKALDIGEGIMLAAEAIDKGRTMETLQQMIAYSRDGVKAC